MEGAVTPILYSPLLIWATCGHDHSSVYNVFQIGPGASTRPAAVEQSRCIYNVKVFELRAVSFNMGYTSLLQ